MKDELLDNFTVVVLSRNHYHFISNCLRSVHREFPDVKTLCVDVGSTDGTYEKGKDLSRELDLNSEHIQLSDDTKTLQALKKIERQISTNYIVLLSSDDALGEGYGSALLNNFGKIDYFAVMNFPSMVSNKDLVPLFEKFSNWSDNLRKNTRLLSYSNPGTTPGAVIPWKVLIGLDSWKNPPDILIEDYWIWWQLIDHVPFINCSESFVFYRQHDKNLSRQSKNKDYAYSLGFVSALPNVKSKHILNRLLSLILIPRWIRHLDVNVWKYFFSGYKSAYRSEKSK